MDSPWGQVVAKTINPYQAKQGQIVELGVVVRNVGDNRGYILAVVRIEWDGNVEEPLWVMRELNPGEIWEPSHVYIGMKDKRVTVKFRAWGWRNNMWNPDSEWIDWITLLAAVFSDPVWETLEIGSNYYKVNIKSINNGNAKGYPYIDIYINDIYDQSKSMPAVDPGQTSVYQLYRGGLNPGANYKFCAYVMQNITS